MGIKRSQLAAILRTVKVDYFGQIVTVTYKPEENTPVKNEEEVREHKEADENSDNILDSTVLATEVLVARLARQMVSWDIVEEDGAPSLPTAENLMTFPYALLVHINMAIAEDGSPKVKTRQR